MFVLMLGFSSLIGLLGVGVSTRRTAELRDQAVYAVDPVLHQARTTWLGDALADDGSARQLDPVVLDSIEGYPRLRAVATPRVDPEEPWLILAVIRITWREEGEVVGEEFRRVIDGHERYASRIARIRSKR